MEVYKPPFTNRNIICATIFGVLAAGYWLDFWLLVADLKRAAREGQRGEAGSLFAIVLIMLALYTSLFFLATFSSALQRGSRPMHWLLLLVGLLPTLVLIWFFGSILLHRYDR